jgi:uncharacterized Zn finger protein
VQFYPPSRPRQVDGGLTARSTRGAIGESWWSKRFIGILEGFALGSRLTRGRNYARRGQVISLDVAAGKATAKVQGSRVTPYKVVIGLSPFTPEVWAQVDAALAAEAIHAAALLAGQFPTDLEGVFDTAGARLFPRSVDELRMNCSCPDWEVPCKHIAASFYLLAERFDDDPFEILHWRGRPREVLLARVRELRSAGTDTDTGTTTAHRAAGTDQAARPSVAGARLALADLVDPTLSPALFWTSPVPTPTPSAAVDTPADLLLRQLPDPPAALGGEDFTQTLRWVYASLPDAEESESRPSRGNRGRSSAGRRG